MSDCDGVHPEELPMMSAAQQSPRGRTPTLINCVQTGLLEQPLFVDERQRVSARCRLYTITNNLMTSVRADEASHSFA